MGKRGREIVGMDVERLLDLLNRAYASEWLAYYQYWLGAKLIRGPMKDAVAAELNLHATEELNHAVLVANRILQLGGRPVLTPEGWAKLSPCKYDAPEDPYVAVLLDQNIAGEQCAISTYKGLMDATKDKDIVTYNMRSRSSSRKSSMRRICRACARTWTSWSSAGASRAELPRWPGREGPDPVSRRLGGLASRHGVRWVRVLDGFGEVERGA